jgi:hypothetical protein
MIQQLNPLKLTSVGGDLDLYFTPINENLTSVGGNWILRSSIESLLNIGTPISKKYSKEEIRRRLLYLNLSIGLRTKGSSHS